MQTPVDDVYQKVNISSVDHVDMCSKYSMYTKIIAVALSCLALLGCASNLVNSGTETRLIPAEILGAEIRSSLDAKFVLDSGYERRILANTKWRLIGAIPSGKVYKREGDSFTIEGSHIHEAHIVVSNGRLIGFFLPVEKLFIPQKDAPLIFGE